MKYYFLSRMTQEEHILLNEYTNKIVSIINTDYFTREFRVYLAFSWVINASIHPDFEKYGFMFRLYLQNVVETLLKAYKFDI